MPLKLDPRARSHCPAAPRGYHTGPTPLLPQWPGRCRSQFSGMRPGRDDRDANSISPGGRSRTATGGGMTGCTWGNQQSTRRSCCCRSRSRPVRAATRARSITYTDDRGVANQPYPTNYRAEILAFMKTYLNNPVGVRDAVMAEPVQRTVGGRLRYVSCLRFAARNPTAPIASRANAPFSLSTAGSIVSSRTPASPVPARSMRRFRSWKGWRGRRVPQRGGAAAGPPRPVP